MVNFAKIAVFGAAVFWSLTAAASVTVSISQPTATTVVGNSLSITASISTPYQITSVQAQVGSVVGSLTATATSTGTIDITSVPIGATTLTVTATDGQGGSGSAMITFKHDLPPSLTVTAPLPGTVARPSLTVAATCTASGAYSCASVQLLLGSTTGTVLASGNPLSQVVGLDSYVGQQLNLYFVATDTAGLQAASTAIPVYVDTSPRLVEVETVSGPIVDVDSTRILFGTTIHTRGTMASSDVLLPAELGTACRLSPNGAFCNAGEWKNGAVVATWAIASSHGEYGLPTFAARGNYAIWTSIDSMGNNYAYFRDSSAGTTTLVANIGVNFAYAEDVSANGDAIFVLPNSSQSDYPVYRYSAGTLSALTDTTGNAKYYSAFTDGINVIYQQWFIGYQGGIFLTTPTGMLTLASDIGCSQLTFAVNNGWTAYASSPDSACNSLQVWTRAPDDTRTQLSIWSTSSTVDAINDSGEVMMLNTSSLGANRYLASPGGSPTVVSSTLGTALWLDGAWYVIMGRTLFSVASATDSDGGVDMSPLDMSVAPADMHTPMDDMTMTASADAATTSDASALVDQGALRDAAQGGSNGHGGCEMACGSEGVDGLVVLLMVLGAGVLRRRRALAL